MGIGDVEPDKKRQTTNASATGSGGGRRDLPLRLRRLAANVGVRGEMGSPPQLVESYPYPPTPYPYPYGESSTRGISFWTRLRARAPYRRAMIIR